MRIIPPFLFVTLGLSLYAPSLNAQEMSLPPGILVPSGLLIQARIPAENSRQDGSTPEAWKAALASLIVPGSGQIWTGRKWGWGLVATEALFIGGGIWAGAKGSDRREQYERFADQYWDRDSYLGYIDEFESVSGSPWPYDHHALPPVGESNHDYYEMIGKYEQFAPGWDDWSAWYDEPFRGNSAHRDFYLQMRLEANRYLKLALTAGGLVFLNHATASAEALVWGLKGGERSRRESGAGYTPWKAALNSLLLPGWGQRMQGKRGLANVLVIVEGLWWGGRIGLSRYSKWRLEDSRRWAAIHAGVILSGKDETYFRYLSLYPDLVTFNAAQHSGMGDPSAAYPAGTEYDWRWSSETEWKRYREMRRDSRLAKSYATLALGGIVAGRLVGAVTALVHGTRSGPSNSGLGPIRRSAFRSVVSVKVIPLTIPYPGEVIGFQVVGSIR